MTSLVRSLLRTSSLTPYGAGGESSAASSPKAPGSPMTTLTSSPSFNDFSLSVAMEAEHDNPFAEIPSRGTSFDVGLMRESVDSRLARDSVEQSRSSTSSRLASWSAGSIFGRSAAINIPVSSSKISTHTAAEVDASAPADGAASARRKGNGKIAGLDYYEFCELIRSSSL